MESRFALCLIGESTTNLWVCNADGAKVRRLNRTSDVCYMPSWQKTPRGERIVFGKHGAKPRMASIKPDGTDEQILGEGHDPTLSPNGRLICYTATKAAAVTVFVMNHDGSEKHQVVKETSKVGATFPNWSPDSKRIVYSFRLEKRLNFSSSISMAPEIANSPPSPVRAFARRGAWSPDGQWISFRRTDERYWSNPARMLKIYSEKPPDKRPVWVVHPDGSEATLIEPLRFQMAIDGSRATWKPESR